MKKSITFTNALMIAIGSVIGSGIFFKTDDILKYTQGDVMIAILGWIVLGATLVFAGMAISILAARTDRNGGVSAYVEDHFGSKAGFAVNWFFSILYGPTQIIIIAWVALMFGLQFFDLTVDDIGVNKFYLILLGILAILFLWNILSTKFSALFSSFSTITKLIPLIVLPLLAFVGLNPANIDNLFNGVSSVANNPDAIEAINASGDIAYESGANFLKLFTGPLLAMAFTFDGWHTVGALSVDMENPKRDLARVFAINALIITAIYVLYFTAITIFMPADQIIAHGDGHLQIITNTLFGNIFGEQIGMIISKSILIILVISCLGSANGATIGAIRYVQALGEDGVVPKADKIKEFNPVTNTPLNAGLISFVLIILWTIVYYMQEGHGWFSGIVIDELPVAMTTLIFIPIMYATMTLYKTEKQNFFKMCIAPVIGMIGQLFILAAFFLNNEQAVLYAAVSFGFVAIGFVVRAYTLNKNKVEDTVSTIAHELESNKEVTE